MRKLKKLLVLLLLLSVLVPYANVGALSADTGPVASVYSTNTDMAYIGLSFQAGTGTSVGTAFCSIKIMGKTGTNKINGDMYLYKVTSRGEILIRGWELSKADSDLNVVKKCSVSKGKYRLYYKVKVHRNGTTETIKREITKTYS